MRKRVDRLGSQAREAAGELGAFAVDSVQGLGEIVAFQQEAARGTKLDQLSQRHIALRLPFFRELTLPAGHARGADRARRPRRRRDRRGARRSRARSIPACCRC